MAAKGNPQKRLVRSVNIYICTDEAQKAKTVLSAVINIYLYYRWHSMRALIGQKTILLFFATLHLYHKANKEA